MPPACSSRFCPAQPFLQACLQELQRVACWKVRAAPEVFKAPAPEPKMPWPAAGRHLERGRAVLGDCERAGHHPAGASGHIATAAGRPGGLGRVLAHAEHNYLWRAAVAWLLGWDVACSCSGPKAGSTRGLPAILLVLRRAMRQPTRAPGWQCLPMLRRWPASSFSPAPSWTQHCDQMPPSWWSGCGLGADDNVCGWSVGLVEKTFQQRGCLECQMPCIPVPPAFVPETTQQLAS